MLGRNSERDLDLEDKKKGRLREKVEEGMVKGRERIVGKGQMVEEREREGKAGKVKRRDIGLKDKEKGKGRKKVGEGL